MALFPLTNSSINNKAESAINTFPLLITNHYMKGITAMINQENTIGVLKDPDKKRCPKCGIEKPKTTEFFRLRSRYKKISLERYNRDFSSFCILCLNDASKINSRLRYDKNKDAINERHKKWYQDNKTERSKKIKEWQDNNRDHFLKLRRRNERKQRLVSAKKVISERMSSRIRGYLSKGTKNNRSWEKLVNYTPDELMKHLESKFSDGMGWHNRSEWHIDHIRPISSFEFSTPEDIGFKECWALENLQPLWAKENIAKRDKWDGIKNG